MPATKINILELTASLYIYIYVYDIGMIFAFVYSSTDIYIYKNNMKGGIPPVCHMCLVLYMLQNLHPLIKGFYIAFCTP